MLVLDTDHISLLQWPESASGRLLIERLETVESTSVCVTIVSFEEQMRGWMASLAKTRDLKGQINDYDRLRRTLKAYCKQTILEFEDRAAVEFQRIRKICRRLGAMDLKIAAITIANDARLLTKNTGDFSQVPGLKFEDWTK
jgi:tRNA(fMet)-specific endonuclease VapC